MRTKMMRVPAVTIAGTLLALASANLQHAAANEPCQPHWDTAIGQPGMNDEVRALAVSDDSNGGPDLYAGGRFTTAGGEPGINRIARWDGSQWSGLGSGMNGSVDALTVFKSTFGNDPLSPHHNLHLVTDLLAQSETENIAILLFGDSRSSWRNDRAFGAVFRKWDVQWAGLFMEGGTSNNGRGDGLGQLIIANTGFTNFTAAPGDTLPGSGVENRWPSQLVEQWVTGTPGNPQFGRFAISQSTSGGVMRKTPSTQGGTFKRGDPSQGRNILNIEFFYIGNNANHWLPFRAEAGYNATETGAIPIQTFEAPTGPDATHVINSYLLPGPDPLTHGEQVYWRHRHVSPPAAGGHVLLGSRLNFEGQKGCILATIAQGGWSTSDHLPPDVYEQGDNTDWKYSDDAFREWYAAAIRSPKVLLRIEIGQNHNTLGGNFSEWNGHNTGNFKHHVRLLTQRAIDNVIAAGAEEVVVQLVSPWQAAGGSPGRTAGMQADLLAIAQEEGWAFYDQQQQLVDGGYTDDGDLKAQYRADSAHQNFAGMELLGEIEWDAIEAAASRTAMFAGGSFIDADGQTVNHIATWDDSQWSPLGAGMDDSVNTLAAFNDNPGSGPALYAGGRFLNAGGQPASRLAHWDGLQWSPLPSEVNDTVAAFAVFDDNSGDGSTLFAGGDFTTAGDQSVSFIAKWDGFEWSSLDSGMDGPVAALAVFDDGSGGGPALYAGGEFITAGGQTVGFIAKWDGSQWSPLDSGMNGPVLTLAVFDDNTGGGPALYAGGAFTTAGGTSANRIAKWDGSQWSPLGSGLNDSVYALAVLDDGSDGVPALYVGGAFTTADGLPANRIAVWRGCPTKPDVIPGDLNGDGSVGVADLLILLASWGPCADCTPGYCAADLNGDCNVGVADLLILLANWG